ncbi:MAG: helix-turn-helix transcriptional regulator [Sandaracinus sp.]|nr:helix-turn-helix transcriptional regulator [Sandaracinus sp.]
MRPPAMLRSFRRSKDWSLRDLAKLLRCHPTMISALENGRRIPGLALAAAIEDLTGGWIRAAEWVRDSPTSEAA